MDEEEFKKEVWAGNCEYHYGKRDDHKDGTFTIKIGGECKHPLNKYKMCAVNLCPYRAGMFSKATPMKEHQKMIAEKAAIDYEKKNFETRSLAATLYQTGKIAISLNWERFEFLDERIIIPCPHCEQHIPWAACYVMELVKMWKDAGGKKSDLIIRSSRNPLGHLVGVPAIIEVGPCPACKVSVTFAAQLVIL